MNVLVCFFVLLVIRYGVYSLKSETQVNNVYSQIRYFMHYGPLRFGALEPFRLLLGGVKVSSFTNPNPHGLWAVGGGALRPALPATLHSLF